VAALTFLLAAGLVLPACGSGGGGSGGQAERVEIEVSGEAKSVELKAPQKIKGGLVQMNLKNSSKGPRDAQIIRIEGDQSAQDVLKVIESQGGPIPDWLQDGGGVGETAPGKTGKVTQNVAEGRYVLVSAPSEDGEPATAELQVEGGSEGELPKTSAEIVATEYSFASKGLKPGKNAVLFKNAGQELHHVVAAPLLPGKTLDDVKKFVSEEGEEGGGPPPGPPPIDFENGFTTAVIDGGIEQVTDLELKKGKYAMICFIQDRTGGPPHVMKGMIAEAEVQ
jgi:hypothetical protein